MAQAILKKVEETEKGILLTFESLEGEKISGIYDRNVLNVEKLNSLIGNQISVDSLTENIGNIHAAWDGKKPTFSDSALRGVDVSYHKDEAR